MTYSGVSSVMGRNRFEALFRNIHFVNNLGVNQDEKSDRLWKLWPWVNSLRENFIKVSLEEHHAVDKIEAITKYVAFSQNSRLCKIIKKHLLS